jgi:hypothetical protein
MMQSTAIFSIGNVHLLLDGRVSALVVTKRMGVQDSLSGEAKTCHLHLAG